MKREESISISGFWNEFVLNTTEYKSMAIPEAIYFCDNKKDADECAELVVKAIKQATSTSLWWFQKYNEPIPKVGDLYIVTNWEGESKAIIQTTKVEKVPFNRISEEYAAIEGEGDKSLAYWKKTHWDYYAREMKPFDESPTEDMIIVCEQFKTIWK